MSKDQKNNTTESVLENSKGKTVEELKEIAVTLQTQLNEHQRQATYHQTMVTKAQGALEVMLQVIPKQEVENMVQQEAKENNQKVANSERV
tara:strand:- start:154 stop:426 length:273 start_codon:yes stop_codon:yes gene_type:complete